MGKKKPTQLYVYRCIKNQGKNVDFGLSKNKYKFGDFISFWDGGPTSSIYEAMIVNPRKKDWYNLRNRMDKNKFDKYFKMCLIEITLKQTIKDIN